MKSYEVREQNPGLMAHEKGSLVRVFLNYSEANDFIKSEIEKRTERSQRLYISAVN